MAARYRERISEDRLAALADRVRAWRLGPGKKTSTKPRTST
jgi:hypothetical protein